MPQTNFAEGAVNSLRNSFDRENVIRIRYGSGFQEVGEKSTLLKLSYPDGWPSFSAQHDLVRLLYALEQNFGHRDS